MPPPILPADDDARSLACRIMHQARSAALGTITPEGEPMVTRIAFGLSPEGTPLTLVSDLATHSTAMRANPAVSLLLGEPGDRGDPLVHPRLTLQARAAFLPHNHPRQEEVAAHYLRGHPKARLYIDFADFSFVLFAVRRAHLNGGFGRAFSLTPADIGLPS